MSTLWSKVTGLFRPKPEPLSAAARINQEILALRELALQLMKSDPETYLGFPTMRAEPFGPGGRLWDQEVDYVAIKIMDGEKEWLQSVNTIYYKNRPNLSDEDVKAYLRRLAEGYRQSQAMERWSWEEACPYFLPRLGLGLSDQCVHLPWGDLGIWLVIDLPEQVYYLGQSHLDRWGRTAEEVLEVAMANLRRRFGETRARAVSLQDAPDLQAWEVLSSDRDVNATLALLPEVTGSVPAPRNSLFVLIPHRASLMFFVRPDSFDRRNDLVTYVAQLNWASGTAISPHLLVWSGDVLVRASGEDTLGYNLEFEEPGVRTHLFTIPDPDTGEKRTVAYPFRQGS